MKARVLTGSKQEIAAKVAEIDGDIREAIVFVEEQIEAASNGDAIFAELQPFTVQAGGADYSRQSLYAPMDGE